LALVNLLMALAEDEISMLLMGAVQSFFERHGFEHEPFVGCCNEWKSESLGSARISQWCSSSSDDNSIYRLWTKESLSKSHSFLCGSCQLLLYHWIAFWSVPSESETTFGQRRIVG